MGKLINLIRRPFSEQRLLLKAVFLLWAVKWGVRFFPFRLVYRVIENRGKDHEKPLLPLDQILTALETAGRHVPGATCLVRALAGRLLLSQYGHRTEIHLGISKEIEKMQMVAHAWLEHQGKVLIGGDIAGYQAFPIIKTLTKEEKIMEENKTVQTKEKKDYEQPEIVDHGSIEKITEQPVLNPGEARC